MARPVSLLLSLLWLLLSGAPAAAAWDRAALDALVEEALRAHGRPLEVSVWLGGLSGAAGYERAAGLPRPTASAIKTAYLIEFFADRPLDQAPPEAAALLDDPAHPAWQPFAAADREAVRRGLRGASARRIGAIMMGSAPAPNAVYNGAANLITALLGGPAALSQRLHQRDPAFAGLAARRYMLARRDVSGDNEAPAAALAAVLQRVASGAVPGLDAPTLEAVRGALLRDRDPRLGPRRYKDGDLDSDPMVQVRSGYYERGLVYVVVLLQRGPGDQPRAEAGRRLDQRATRLTRRLVEEALKGM